jgi:hypothetical protein
MNYEAIFEQVQSISLNVGDGFESPLKAYIELKNLESLCKELKDQIQADALNEANAFKGQVYHGYQIDVREVGGRYSYDHIEEIVTLKEKIKELEKASQMSWKMSNSGAIMMNEQTGEVTPPAHYKGGSTAIILKAI